VHHLWDHERFLSTGALFPVEITDDPWVLYHGTSAEYSDAIERCGLQWQPGVYTRADVVAVMRAFYMLRWDGASGQGAATLRSFTQNDFGAASSKPVYLAETAWRASRYGTRECSGGETASALRDALNDLLLYLADPAVRDAHQRANPADFTSLERPWPEIAELAGSREIFDLPDEQRARWVEAQLAKLVRIQANCAASWIRYRHGVVYAVRIVPSDRQAVTPRRAGGFEWHGKIDGERLIGKVDLPPNYERIIDLYRDPPQEFVRRYKTPRLWDSCRAEGSVRGFEGT